MMQHPSSQQVDIFSDDQRQLHFAELCNALYERELNNLAQQKFNSVSLLQRKIIGLKHHIKRVADNLLDKTCPLNIDIHNASWQAKQAAKCMVHQADPEKTEQWFLTNALLGRPIAIYVSQLGEEHIELDSIDKIDSEQKKLHANKWGWFSFDGKCLSPLKEGILQQLLKPSKATFTAACCGHTWNHKGKSQTRTLTLRELHLSIAINWKTFK